jgi:hypothetical protein
MIDAEALALWALAATHGVTRLRELARMTGLAPHALQAGLQGLRRQGYAACEGRAWQMTPRGILLARVAGRIGGAESVTTPWSLNTAIVAEGILTMLAAELPPAASAPEPPKLPPLCRAVRAFLACPRASLREEGDTSETVTWTVGFPPIRALCQALAAAEGRELPPLAPEAPFVPKGGKP